MKERLLLGFYYGIGDFISAVPILMYLSKQDKYDIYVLVGNQNKQLTHLLNLQGINYIYFSLFSTSNFVEHIKLLTRLLKIKFNKIIVSPHPQDHQTSWKIPILLKCLKTQNRSLEIIGSFTDKNSFLYDRKIPIDKTISLMQREINMLKMAGFINYDACVDIETIFNIKRSITENIISIHVGASKDIRKWNDEYVVQLCKMLLNIDKTLRIKIIGLGKELVNLKNIMRDINVTYIEGTLDEAIKEIITSKAVITMDSGFSHIASSLGLNHIVLFGSADPKCTKPIFNTSHYIHKKIAGCQPCNKYYCNYGKNYCMEAITPDDVLQKLKNMSLL